MEQKQTFRQFLQSAPSLEEWRRNYHNHKISREPINPKLSREEKCQLAVGKLADDLLDRETQDKIEADFLLDLYGQLKGLAEEIASQPKIAIIRRFASYVLERRIRIRTAIGEKVHELKGLDFNELQADIGELRLFLRRLKQ